ncbi:MAG: acetylxylan esterase [Planctomycetota bacterium]
MAFLDLPLDHLQTYTGTNPRPAGFDGYWDRALAELDETEPAPEITPARGFSVPFARCEDLLFTGVGGARIYAKLVRPTHPSTPVPGVLGFHGYKGASEEWPQLMKWVGAGVACAFLDCRGQGGRSIDPGGVTGNTHHGHIIRGLADGPEHLYYRSVFLDTVQLARVVAALDDVDSARMGCFGASQGGGLSLACAALHPSIKRCVSIYPFLSDYKRVWKIDIKNSAYAEIERYFRHNDPTHARADETWTALGHIDVHHLAPRITAEVLMGLSQQDNVCPPSTQFAAYNAIRSTKSCDLFPDFAHEHLPGFWERAYPFLIGL